MEYVIFIMDVGKCLCEYGKCLCQSGSKSSHNLFELKENLASLERKMGQLNNLKQDVKTRVEQDEQQQQMQRTNQVESWLRQVEEIEALVTRVLQQGKEEDSKNCFPKNYWATYKLGKQVSKWIGELDELSKQGNFDVLAHRLPRAPADEMPMENTVGLDSMFEHVWRSFEEESARIIGLYGIGGVGKTTLLKRINNQFSNIDHNFAYVIWIAVSKEVNVEKIQEKIRNKLEIPNTIWMNRSEDERAAEIYKVLKGKKFVVLLDDIWERFDLSKVGFPLPDEENKSKLIFTTRSEEVCACMEADRRLRVECLPEKAALSLFLKMVGEETLNTHQEIPKLAEIAARECGGLPLALITIGRAMASRRNPNEWKHAIKSLQSYPSKFSGMQDHVFPILEFSYDSLSNEIMKTCFLYCSLFPEDYLIPKDELINLWIGEEFLGRFDSIHDARNEGEYVIGSLKLACLLEGAEFRDHLNTTQSEFVWMHDVIRDMALWLACEYGKKEGKFLVQAGTVKANTEEVEKMSCWGYDLAVMNGITNFPNLQTLFFRDFGCHTFPTGFFHHMQKLTVLDLSGNSQLATLPEGIGVLINLRHLNLSWTAVFELPIEIKNLKNLKRLILDNTRSLRMINRDVIPSLVSLQGFSKLASADFLRDEYLNEVDMLDDLESLEKLEDLTINLCTKNAVEKFLESPHLQECIRQLSLMECPDMETFRLSFSSMRRMKHLEKLDIEFCFSLLDLKVDLEEEEKTMKEYTHYYHLITNTPHLTDNQSFRSLRVVHIRGCPMMDLTWLQYAPSLEILELYLCNSMKEVISVNCEQPNSGASNILFSNLTKLYLDCLPNLSWISQQALCFPSLIEIFVCGCPNLKKFPFESSKSLKIIKGERSWWDELQWENEHLRDVFGAKFVEWNGNLAFQVQSFLSRFHR